ncbi:MAG: sodium:solute symporter [Planctomycetota bacterium]|nr:MAG: sodium:solute symporter [Planctomycetota bacterium]
MQSPASQAAPTVDVSASFSFVDGAVIAAYALVVLVSGLWLSRRAGKNLESYFLGGRSLPWYMLGVSNASGMFDISGTMLMVYWLFVYGLKSVWIPWLWPVFNQVFLMAYLSIWMRRSGVMTGAEWIRFRFGDSRGARWAHLIVVVFAIVNVVGFLAYGFIGIGKFAATFLPWQLSADPVWNVNLYGLLITALTTVYVVKGGMFSVVFTEVFQFVVMTVGCLWVAGIAMHRVSPEMLAGALPAGWGGLAPSWRLDVDWSQVMPAASEKIAQDGWQLFGALWGLMLAKGVLQSMAGPAPNYDMQRILSARSPREAALMSWFVNVVLLIPRYMLITGLTVLALVFFTDELNAMGEGVDFELILPLAMKHFVPAGLFGVLIAALLAAFMSTYAATVNAAPAYIVNDIYKRYVNPHASERTYVWMSYATSVAVVVVGTAFGFMTEALNEVVKWIAFALGGGYTAANVLKWHWWRFNSYGYFWGMVAGMAAAGALPLLLPDQSTIWGLPAEVVSFPAIFAVSLLGCIAGSLTTAADDLETLKRFYRQVRPWGAWGPVHELVRRESPALEPNRDFPRDMANVGVGIVWQTALTAAGVYLVLRWWTLLAVSAGVIAATSMFLKVNWYDKLRDYPSDDPEVDVQSPSLAPGR